jgi:MFS family permease
MTPRDYRLFLASQAISNLGSSFTLFGLPLLVYRLTGSAVNLALSTAAGFLPYLLFGLVIGAMVDRVDRRRTMLVTNVARALTVGVVPALAASGTLTIWWLYATAFVNAALGIVSAAIEVTAVPSLVPRDALADANGKLRATYAVCQVIGPLLAGVLIGGGLPVTGVFVVDAASFVVAALVLLGVRTPLNTVRPTSRSSVATEVRDGLAYVRSDPVLSNVALHAALWNLIGGTVLAQLVLFAHDRLAATDAQVAVLFAGGSLGTAGAVFAVGRLGGRLSFRAATLGLMLCWCGLVLGLALTTNFWVAAVFWTAAAGLPAAYAVRTITLRQEVVPDHLLGRVQTIAQVLAWSAQPVGALAGAWLIQVTGRISAVYAGIAVLFALVTAGFWLGPLGRVDTSTSDQALSGAAINGGET